MISYFKQKGKLTACEDSLTATVFDGLKHLPVEMFWRILKNSLYYDKLPYSSGEIQSISYWEHWNSNETDNKNFVEPDIFIRFHEFDLIVEAKRYDKNQQIEGQMQKEIVAYYNEYANDQKQLYFIQLGGLNDKKDDISEYKEKEVTVCKTDWSRLLDQISSENKNLNKYSSSINMAFSRIFEDIIVGLSLHGYNQTLWMENINLTNTNYNAPLNIFSYAK